MSYNEILRHADAGSEDNSQRIVYGYSRVSTAEQADSGLSLPYQERRCHQVYREAFAPKGFRWGGMMADEGVSATVPLARRKAGRALVTQVKRGDIIVCIRSDRPFRNMREGLNMLHDWIGRGVGLHDIALNQTYSPDNPAGMFQFHILMAAAELERSMISNRTKDAAMERAMQGKASSQYAPPGFRFADKKKRLLAPDNHERSVMARILQWYQQGSSIRAIVEYLKELGIVRTDRGVFWKPKVVERAIKDEPLLREIQRKIARGELDPRNVPVHLRNMDQLECCQRFSLPDPLPLDNKELFHGTPH